MDVVVVGSVNADLVVKVERRPAPGETVMGSDLDTFPGGKGANQAVAAARLGADVALLARTGTDQYGTRLVAGLAAEGVSVEHVVESEGASGVALITVDADGDNSIIVSPGANARLTPADVAAAADLLGGAAVVSLMLEIPLETVTAAARAARRAVLNASPPRPLPRELLALADPLVVNEHEAAFLLGSEGDPAGMARALLALGPRSVVITLGAEGAVVAESSDAARPVHVDGSPDRVSSGDLPDHASLGPRGASSDSASSDLASGARGPSGRADGVVVTVVPSPVVDAVDTTGAGDAFTGALAWRLALGDTLPEAAALAVKVGAAAVRREGAQSSYPRMEEL
ncbi:ribokinase [Nonomuraea africana]|uniref:Ribokinase n=1 Tax=Nonomuraea africana TaxID=46171 RepID=A0ABR9KA21_9ACTN|nr:ribokinase [Nonomuraea africana]MBE1558860.1 ribokinase [Nonomuraea africana]